MHSKKAITATVVAGLGEGAFFMSMQHYQKEIRDELGFVAYPGTLNLKVPKNKTKFFFNTTPIKIKGYKTQKRIFGGASCYKARIKNIEGSIIIPDISKHKKDIIEFIAPVHLKSKLNIKDGDKVRIELSK